MARSARPDFGEKKPFNYTIDVDDAFSFLDDFKQSPNYPKTGAELGLSFPYTPNKFQILGDMLRGAFGIDTVEARNIVGMWFERNSRLRTESKKKIIRLTESDLTRIVKRVIKENKSRDEVQKLISLLMDNNLVDQDKINVYKDHIEVYGINGYDGGYFLENFIRLYPYDITSNTVYINGEYYEEEIDEEEYEEVLNYIFENWEPLLGIEFIE
jgi:hypothetical protein